DRFGDRHILAWAASELLRHRKRLREEALDLAGAADDQLVLVRKLLDTENGDDILQVLVALQHTLHLASHAVVLLADDVRVENAAGRSQRVHRRVDTLSGDAALERD